MCLAVGRDRVEEGAAIKGGKDGLVGHHKSGIKERTERASEGVGSTTEEAICKLAQSGVGVLTTVGSRCQNLKQRVAKQFPAQRF